MSTRSLVIATLAIVFGFAAASGVQAKSRNNSHSEKGAANHQVSSGSGSAAKKAGQKQAKKKKKTTAGDTSDYLVIKLNDASVLEY